MLTFAVYLISKHRRDPLVEPSAYFVARQELDHSWASGAITGEEEEILHVFCGVFVWVR